MKVTRFLAASAALAFLAFAALAPRTADAVGPPVAALTSDSRLAAAVEVRNVAVARDEVMGTVVNRSTRELSEVVLLITRAWLWKDERNPGPINPGGSYYYTLRAPVAPGASASFTYKLPAVDAPADLGSFATTVQAVGYTEVSYPGR